LLKRRYSRRFFSYVSRNVSALPKIVAACVLLLLLGALEGCAGGASGTAIPSTSTPIISGDSTGSSRVAYYSATPIPLENGCTVDVPARMNAGGTIVGIEDCQSAPQFRAFEYAGGRLQRFPSYKGLPVTPTAINDSGVVVGYANDPATHDAVALFLSATCQTIPGVSGYSSSYAYAIDNAGDVTGFAASPTAATDPEVRAYLYRGGKTIPVVSDYGALASFGYDVDDGGRVLGITYSNVRPPTTQDVVVFDSPTHVTTLHTGGFAQSTAVAINARGHALYTVATSPYASDAYLYNGSDSQRLPGLPGFATNLPVALNDSDEVVGESCAQGSSGCEPYVWRNAAITDLKSLVPPNVTFEPNGQTVLDVNASGQILMLANLNGNYGLVVLTPPR
jgi:uncharacterized membrane protein